jgi:hypothetical protein
MCFSSTYPTYYNFKNLHLKIAELREGEQTAGLGLFTVEIIQTA